MIELVELRKSYKTGDFEQKALDGVSLNLRNNEFVAILGPSGSGKTTLLNVIGGLDHADSGDVIIDGISTKDYKSKDWDTYRNHHIGFIFQSYNLIPHQTVLKNVELALTLAGVDRSEREKRAKQALDTVGLSEHVNKKPGQLSGGQMQRVAIARALVNNPDIVLADEPTGALDTETGIQVMDLLKEVSKDRLVVMVTHNPDLAERYATRIVRLADGRITDDNDPFYPDFPSSASARNTAAVTAPIASRASNAQAQEESPLEQLDQTAEMQVKPSAGAAEQAGVDALEAAKSGKRASMSFLTALGLSFNNLMTKKGRTFLTSFAGAIGIIGIAAILAISTGMHNYIYDTEEQAMSSYPLTVTKSSLDMTSLLVSQPETVSGTSDDSDSTGSINNQVIDESTIMSDMFAQVKNNDLTAFREFLESDESGIQQYVNYIGYDYGIDPLVYESDTETNGVVQLNPSSLTKLFSSSATTSSLTTNMPISNTGVFHEMIDNSDMLEEQMEVVTGRWPENYDEAVLVLNKNGSISDYTLYSIGVYDPDVMNDMITDALNDEEVDVPEIDPTFTYGDALNLTFSIVPSCNLYSYNAEQGTWTDRSSDEEYMKTQVENGVKLKIVGVVKPSEDSQTSLLSEGIAYSPELTQHLIEIATDSDIVKQQQADPDVDVFTGKTFEELQDSQSEEFDLTSMFTIDEDALASAFSFDSSALDTSSLGDIDLSGIDTSNMASDIDSSNVDSSAISSVINSDSIAAIVAGAPEPDLSDIDMSDISTDQQNAIRVAQANLVTGFMGYVSANSIDTTDQDALVQAYAAYLQTTEGREAYTALQQASGAAYAEAVQSAMDDYMTNTFAPYLASQMQELMTQAAEVMVTEMSEQMAAQMALATGQLGSQLSDTISSQLESQMSALSESLSSGFSVDADAFADAIQFNMSQEDLTSLLTNYMNADELTYNGNLEKLGYADLDNPESISIYPKDFDAKESVLDIIDNYNQRMTDEGRDDETIEYSDIAGTLLDSVSDIVDAISMVLIAFVSISLVVSSIMIAIITYISVLERKKEIGILRAIGASKGNIANVFNAETIIEGLLAGIIAIAVVYIATPPVNAFVYAGWGVPNVMALRGTDALILIGISVLLTFIAGLIPSTMAARRDPVEALRSE